MHFRSIFLGSALTVFFAASAHAAPQSVTLADCMTDAGSAGDLPNRSFYFRAYPARNLATVTLAVVNDNAGGETLVLTAHHETFDGAVIGTATASLVAATPGNRRLTFDFGGAPTIPGETIAFSIDYVSDAGAVFLDTGNNGPCPAVETNGSDAPLSTFRRPSMGIVVTTLAPALTSVTPNSGITAGGSAVTLNGTNFMAPSNVTFGDAGVTSAITVGADGGSLGLSTPPNSAGSVDINVETLYQNDGGVDAGAISTLAAGYTYGDVVIPADSGSISTTDGGSGGGGSDGGGATTTRNDAGTDNGNNGDSSGCGCRVVGEDQSSSMIGAALVGMIALFGLRRKRR